MVNASKRSSTSLQRMQCEQAEKKTGPRKEGLPAIVFRTAEAIRLNYGVAL